MLKRSKEWISQRAAAIMLIGVIVFAIAVGLVAREVSIGTVERAELALREEQTRNRAIIQEQQARSRAVALCETQNDMRQTMMVVMGVALDSERGLSEQEREILLDSLQETLAPLDCSLEGDFVQRRMDIERSLLELWMSQRQLQESEESTDSEEGAAAEREEVSEEDDVSVPDSIFTPQAEDDIVADVGEESVLLPQPEKDVLEIVVSQDVEEHLSIQQVQRQVSEPLEVEEEQEVVSLPSRSPQVMPEDKSSPVQPSSPPGQQEKSESAQPPGQQRKAESTQPPGQQRKTESTQPPGQQRRAENAQQRGQPQLQSPPGPQRGEEARNRRK